MGRCKNQWNAGKTVGFVSERMHFGKGGWNTNGLIQISSALLYSTFLAVRIAVEFFDTTFTPNMSPSHHRPLSSALNLFKSIITTWPLCSCLKRSFWRNMGSFCLLFLLHSSERKHERDFLSFLFDLSFHGSAFHVFGCKLLQKNEYLENYVSFNRVRNWRNL